MRRSHSKMCYWSEYFQVQQTDRFAGNFSWEACLSTLWGEEKEEEFFHSFPSVIGLMFTEGDFLPLHPWVVSAWMEPLYNVKKEAPGQDWEALRPQQCIPSVWETHEIAIAITPLLVHATIAIPAYYLPVLVLFCTCALPWQIFTIVSLGTLFNLFMLYFQICHQIR